MPLHTFTISEIKREKNSFNEKFGDGLQKDNLVVKCIGVDVCEK